MLESCYSCHKAAGKPMIRPDSDRAGADDRQHGPGRDMA
jgi:hypothetical protein